MEEFVVFFFLLLLLLLLSIFYKSTRRHVTSPHIALSPVPSPIAAKSTFRRKYDVFLSFRGGDTRTKFTDHLYDALRRSGIHTFRDDNELERGEEIGPELLKAIEDSKFSIIVFSINYASSTWCLDELAHIIKCKQMLGQTVLPVFYYVEPSVVRRQTGSFEKAFAKHGKRFKEEMDKLKRWRDALEEAADLSGYAVDGHEYESTIIDEIVKDISEKLGRKRLNVAMNPVGLDSRADVVKSLLYDESIDVCTVGIHGMGGIGKTTIAKEVYNSMILEFEASCFLVNVREISNSKSEGMVQLQKQLLSEILKGKHEEIYNVDRGIKVIEERLCSMRVLIVLDDVDELEQLNNILGNRQWLYTGSRIIITTRIEDLLKPSRVYRQYQVKELDQDESLQLFSITAFGEWHPMEEYMECAERVVRYAGGIPLALEVLGSSLNGRNVAVWNSALEKLKAIPDPKIQNILEISYNSLDDTGKNIFLDIACFFTGKDKDYVISILDGCGFHPIAGIDNLIRRYLVKIDYQNKLVMHDLIQDMGREIVRRECPEEPGNRSRVWHHDGALDLLTDETGTNAVQGLSLNLLEESSELLSTEAFGKMKILRLLQLKNVHLTGSYNHISKKLRWLCWRECPLESIPADLHMRNVVALDMRYSSLKQVWEEVKSLRKLKFLNLSHSHKLTKTPDFTGLPILEILMLKDCTSLVEVHESVGLLTKLVFLNLKDCRNLMNLPKSICALRSLKNLNLSGCSKLDELPEELGNMESLVVFNADGTAISQVPKTIANLKNLRSLSLRECQLAPPPMKGPILISCLPGSLRQLDLRYCNLFDMIPDDLQNLPQLEDLKLCGNKFSSLPASVGLLPNLRHLWLNECKRLQSVPQLQSSVGDLQAENCTSLARINLTNYHGDSGLNLVGCNELVEIEGFFKLEPVGVEHIKKLLVTNGLSMEVSIASVRVHMINNLTRTSRISPLQGLSESGIYSIFLPGNEIPSWFSHQSKGDSGDSISFNVPPLQGCKILGFIICAVYAWEECSESCFIFPNITITNKTKMFDWIYEPKVSFFLNIVEEDIMWLSHWRFENKMEGIDAVDMSWRFKNELEGGDQVEVSIDMGYGILVKKCGVHLLYQQNDKASSEIKELAMIPRASASHHRRLRESTPRWSMKGCRLNHRHLAITSHKRISVHERMWFEQPPFTSHNLMDFVIAKNKYTRWEQNRTERVNQRPLPSSNQWESHTL